MHRLRLSLACLACALLTATALAGSRELSGVKVEDTVALGGTTLALNGAGIRYKGPFKVYVGTLYTSKKVNSLEALVAAPGPKRLTMTMLREVESESFGRLLTRGVEDNTPKNEMAPLVPGLLRMSEIFAANKTLAPGESILVDWIPGTGMVVTAKNKVQGEPFKEPVFYRAIMSIWFGPVPADFKLKDALLGLPS